VFTVSSAIHIRTGQRALADTLDQWLARHDVTTRGFDDVYAACVHLLQQYEQIPDLALVGTDWLAPDELSIIAYVRQTWPRTGVVVYGGQRETPRIDLWPLTRAVQGEAGLQKLTGRTPSEIFTELCAEMPPLATRGGESETPARPTREVVAASGEREARELEAPRPSVPAAPPRAILTPEELAVLLEPRDDR
jgi:hypothetical protein